MLVNPTDKHNPLNATYIRVHEASTQVEIAVVVAVQQLSTECTCIDFRNGRRGCLGHSLPLVKLLPGMLVPWYAGTQKLPCLIWRFISKRTINFFQGLLLKLQFSNQSTVVFKYN